MQSIKEFFREHQDYVKDNPEGYWFKRKLYGWGWTPARWQGWVVLWGFILFLVCHAILLELSRKRIEDIVLFCLNEFFAVIAILLICKLKGETPKWQWGVPKKENKP